MKTSLVISTYNWPEALELVLKSILIQTLLPDEILIADDGSTIATSALIDKYTSLFAIPLKHIWQEDTGFRKATILNKTIHNATGDYIIQIDGDCILQKRFIEDHVKKIEPGCYLFGSRVNIKKTSLSFIFSQQQIKFKPNSSLIKNKSRAIHSVLLSNAFSKKNIISPKYRGCNTSFFKSDFKAVNGYNEDFNGWGREDSELAIRFHNYGLLGKRLRYFGIVYHIYHKEKSKENLKKNNTIEIKTITSKSTWCENGINKYKF